MPDIANLLICSVLSGFYLLVAGWNAPVDCAYYLCRSRLFCRGSLCPRAASAHAELVGQVRVSYTFRILSLTSLLPASVDDDLPLVFGGVPIRSYTVFGGVIIRNCAAMRTLHAVLASIGVLLLDEITVTLLAFVDWVQFLLRWCRTPCSRCLPHSAH